MLYRSKKYGLVVVAVVVGLVGAYGSTRADDPSNDLELQLKQKEAQYEELEQKLKAERDKAIDQTKKTTVQARQINDQARQIADKARQQAEHMRFTFGQAPLRTRVEPGAAEAIHMAAEAVRDAKGDDEKSVAQKKLNEALSKYFDEDMVQREKELKQVEERVTKLHDLLERRRSSKQEIVDLEAKVALNQANGLGFYDGESPGGGAPSHL
ncbi:MAG TPA: hypothetical protein VHU84_00210, partial [Lacipirellulaceae bacterium]|nr:hypothetical protein [Lacipirellulaceae bacterium]